MNITLALQELDDLIIRNTQPPVTPMLRNKLHTLRDQIESYITEKENLTTDHSDLVKKYQALQMSKPKEFLDGPHTLKANLGKFPRQPR